MSDKVFRVRSVRVLTATHPSSWTEYGRGSTEGSRLGKGHSQVSFASGRTMLGTVPGLVPDWLSHAHRPTLTPGGTGIGQGGPTLCRWGYGCRQRHHGAGRAPGRQQLPWFLHVSMRAMRLILMRGNCGRPDGPKCSSETEAAEAASCFPCQAEACLF